MMNGKTPLYLTLFLLVLLGATLLFFQPYTADWPGTSYAAPAREYIRAAIRQDSLRLERLSASSTPVSWALQAARSHPESLALWSRRIDVWTGEVRGNTAEVFVYPHGEHCDQAPLVLRFVGRGRDRRVAQASSACLE